MKRIITKPEETNKIFVKDIVFDSNFIVGVKRKNYSEKGLLSSKRYIGFQGSLPVFKTDWIVLCAEGISLGNSWGLFSDIPSMNFPEFVSLCDRNGFEVYLFDSFSELSEWLNKKD